MVDQSTSARIAGGQNARPGKHPYLVSLQFGKPPLVRYQHFCGGSVLNENWILTAADCLDGVELVLPFGTLVVKAGKYDLDKDEIGEQMARVDVYYKHPKFMPGM